jgi:hypothetical protein
MANKLNESKISEKIHIKENLMNKKLNKNKNK